MQLSRLLTIFLLIVLCSLSEAVAKTYYVPSNSEPSPVSIQYILRWVINNDFIITHANVENITETYHGSYNMETERMEMTVLCACEHLRVDIVRRVFKLKFSSKETFDTMECSFDISEGFMLHMYGKHECLYKQHKDITPLCRLAPAIKKIFSLSNEILFIKDLAMFLFDPPLQCIDFITD